jgi:hypothetical protein
VTVVSVQQDLSTLPRSTEAPNAAIQAHVIGPQDLFITPNKLIDGKYERPQESAEAALAATSQGI